MVKVLIIHDCLYCHHKRYYTEDKTDKCQVFNPAKTIPERPTGFNSKQIPAWCPLPTPFEFFMERLQ